MRTNLCATFACLCLMTGQSPVSAQAQANTNKNPFAGYHAQSEPEDMCTGGIDPGRWPPAAGDSRGRARIDSSSFPAADYDPYRPDQGASSATHYAFPPQSQPSQPQIQQWQAAPGSDYGYRPEYGYGSSYGGYYGQYPGGGWAGPYSPAPPTPWTGIMPFTSITTPFPAFW